MAAPHRPSIVSSDEKIAETLQEEFDIEAAVEAANVVIPVTDQLQGEVWAQAFRNLNVSSSALGESQVTISGKNAKSLRDSIANAEVRIEPERGQVSDSSRAVHHSPRNSIRTEEEDRQLALALSEGYSQVDKELARRLHDLDSTPILAVLFVQHIPKVNGEIPPVDAASVDHQRLLDRFSIYGLTERRIAGDGNCQFRALSDQLYRSPEYHNVVREKIVSQLTKSVDSYSGYVPMVYDEYLRKMAKDGEWGDHVTLQAAADYYGVKISLITSFKDTCFIEIMPSAQKIYSRDLFELLGGGSLQLNISPWRVTRSSRQLGRGMTCCQQVLVFCPLGSRDTFLVHRAIQTGL